VEQCLQATLVEIQPTRIRLLINLTPGTEVAGKVIALLDGDQDGVISPQEGETYLKLLGSELTAGLDGEALDLKVGGSSFPPPGEFNSGHAIIQAEFLAVVSIAEGEHRLSIENRHLREISAYLVNATRPRWSTVEVLRQNRNENQTVGEIEFLVRRPGEGMKMLAGIAAVVVVLVAVAWRRRRGRRALVGGQLST
jgi:hypothetical protein